MTGPSAPQYDVAEEVSVVADDLAPRWCAPGRRLVGEALEHRMRHKFDLGRARNAVANMWSITGAEYNADDMASSNL